MTTGIRKSGENSWETSKSSCGGGSDGESDSIRLNIGFGCGVEDDAADDDEDAGDEDDPGLVDGGFGHLLAQ